MELRRLRYFVAAAEEENFRRAAERLHIAQPALSKQIALLERHLGCSLFSRVKRRVVLTPVGRLYLEDARRIIRELDLANQRVRLAAEGKVGTLRIGLRETAGRSQLVSRTCRRFRQSYPEVELRLQQMTSPAQSRALWNGELDAGFIYLSPEHDEGLARLAVAEDRFYLALHRAHPLVKKERIRLQDLTYEPLIWLARSHDAYYSDALLRDCIAGGLTPRIIQEADNEPMSLNLVAVGMGSSFVVAPNDDPPMPDVILKPVVELSNVLILALVWREDTLSPLTDNFVKILSDVMALSA